MRLSTVRCVQLILQSIYLIGTTMIVDASDQLICAAGWTFVNGRCWRFYDSNYRSWRKAADECDYNGGKLASIKSPKDNQILSALTLKTQQKRLVRLSASFREMHSLDQSIDNGCFERMPNRAAPNAAKASFFVSVLNQCLSECSLSKSKYGFWCRSVMYNTETGLCFLNTDRQPVRKTASTATENLVYYRNFCEKPRTSTPIDDRKLAKRQIKCFALVRNSALFGFADAVANNLTVEQCQQDCLDSQRKHHINCKSVSYYRSDRSCVLTEQSRQTKPELFGAEPEADYFERDPNCRPDTQSPVTLTASPTSTRLPTTSLPTRSSAFSSSISRSTSKPVTRPSSPRTTTSRPSNVNKRCENSAQDLLFVVDSSDSIGPIQFEKVRQFLRSITDRLPIGPEAINVGLIRFNETANSEFLLKSYQTADQVMDAIDRMQYTAGGTLIGRALQFAIIDQLTSIGGDRFSGDNSLLVISDGFSEDSPQMIANRIRSTGTTTYAISVTDAIDERQLMQIAGDRDRIFNLKQANYSSETLLTNIVDHVCNKKRQMFSNTTTRPPPRYQYGGQWLSDTVAEDNLYGSDHNQLITNPAIIANIWIGNDGLRHDWTDNSSDKFKYKNGTLFSRSKGGDEILCTGISSKQRFGLSMARCETKLPFLCERRPFRYQINDDRWTNSLISNRRSN